jgi:hypothetical protein
MAAFGSVARLTQERSPKPAAASDMESRRDPAVRIGGVGLHMTAAQRGSAQPWITLG